MSERLRVIAGSEEEGFLEMREKRDDEKTTEVPEHEQQKYP